jgi:hypothetical protein
MPAPTGSSKLNHNKGAGSTIGPSVDSDVAGSVALVVVAGSVLLLVDSVTVTAVVDAVIVDDDDVVAAVDVPLLESVPVSSATGTHWPAIGPPCSP